MIERERTAEFTKTDKKLIIAALVWFGYVVLTGLLPLPAPWLVVTWLGGVLYWVAVVVYLDRSSKNRSIASPQDDLGNDQPTTPQDDLSGRQKDRL